MPPSNGNLQARNGVALRRKGADVRRISLRATARAFEDEIRSSGERNESKVGEADWCLSDGSRPSGY
jgi:hypothetical protein